MGKILLWVLIGVAAYAAWRLVVVSQRRQERSRSKDASDGTAQAPSSRAQLPESIVPCAHCGLQVPRSEALASTRNPELHYCSDTHRQNAEGGP